MNEVSCRALETLFHSLDVRGIARERLVEGLGIELAELRRPGERIDWDRYVELLERLEKLCGGLEVVEEIGGEIVDSAPLKAARALSFFFGSVRHVYWMGCRWVGPSFVSHVRYAYREIDRERVEVQIEIPEPYRGSPQFFAMNTGALRRLPRLLGIHEDAEIEGTITSHSGVWVIRPPRSVSLLSLLRRVTQLPFAAWTAVEELADQQAGLNRALEEVRESGRRLESGKKQVETVEQIGYQLLQELESERLPDQLLAFLKEQFAWQGASLFMTTPEDERLVFYGNVGTVDGDATATHELSVAGSRVGRLEVWHSARASSGSDDALLEKLLPWISVTILNTRVAASAKQPSGSGTLQWVSQSGDDLFMILDEAGQILYAGPGSDDLFGYDRDDFMQLDVTELVHPDDWPRIADVFASLSEHSSSAMYSSARVHHRDGSWRRVEGVAVKVVSEGGADVFLISMGQTRELARQH